MAPLSAGPTDEQVPYPSAVDGGTDHARVAIDDAGNAVVAYSFGDAIVANYRPAGGSVGAPTTLSSAGTFADLALSGGRAMLVYREADQALWRVSSPAGAWQSPVQLGPTKSTLPPRFAVGAGGVLACWELRSDTTSDAYFSYAATATGTFSTAVALGLPSGIVPQYNGTALLYDPHAVWLSDDTGLIVWGGAYDTTSQRFSSEWSGGTLSPAIVAKGIGFGATAQLVAGPGEAGLFGDQSAIEVTNYQPDSGWTPGKGVVSQGIKSDFVYLSAAEYAVGYNDVAGYFDLAIIQGGMMTDLVRVSEKAAEAAFVATPGDGSALILWSTLRNDPSGTQYLDAFYARYEHGVISELKQLEGKQPRQVPLAAAVNAAGRGALVWTDGADAIADLHLSLVDE